MNRTGPHPEPDGFIRFCLLLVLRITFNPYFNVQRDATMSSQYFILLQYFSTCFGFPLHPSSGVQETVVTVTGIGHIPVSWEA
jgi:hypothetical protein